MDGKNHHIEFKKELVLDFWQGFGRLISETRIGIKFCHKVLYLPCVFNNNYESDFNHILFSHSSIMDPREKGRIAYNLALKQKEMVDLETSKLSPGNLQISWS